MELFFTSCHLPEAIPIGTLPFSCRQEPPFLDHNNISETRGGEYVLPFHNVFGIPSKHHFNLRP